MRLFDVTVSGTHYGLCVAEKIEDAEDYYTKKFHIPITVVDITDKYTLPVMEINVSNKVKDIIK